MFIKMPWQALVVSPCILGVILVANISPSLAESDQTTEPNLTLTKEMTTSLESLSIDDKITPLQIPAWELSQTTVNPDTSAEMNTDSSSPNTEENPVELSDNDIEETSEEWDSSDSQTTASDSNRWHFLLQPYLYLPITIYGDTNVGRLSGDIDIDFDEIKTSIEEDLNFLFFGNFQAWTPNYHLGILANVDYLSTSADSTLTRPVRYPGAAEFIPSELETNVDTELWSIDLAAAYRFYNQSQVNPEGVASEFDLGLLVFDVFGGLNITIVSADLDLETNLGGEASFDGSKTVVSPLLGGRLRVNVAPNLALVTAGSVSGFGIEGLTNWGLLAGIDWMFAGDTSLGIGYRFGYTNYNNDLDSGKDFGVTLNQNGPYLSFSFRF